MEVGIRKTEAYPARGIKRFYPDLRRKSAYTIEYEKLYEEGYRGVIFDIDNTLVPHGAPATKEAIDFFEKLHRIGYSTCLLSNNQKPRVEPFALAVDSIFIEDAHKPSRKNYWKACERMGTQKDQTLFVGDQLFTDVYGAKRAGLLNILVEPIHPKEEIQIVLKRYLEKIVLYFYERDQRKSGL
ncbi:MAG: YqeG family HAD IIIA-type phosphatase [Fusicatenibacter sp.]|nr:YqeG family HAD IIIA-type phosphatase [Fusicatenibacter sp.]